jgi:hypothetical protein
MQLRATGQGRKKCPVTVSDVNNKQTSSSRHAVVDLGFLDMLDLSYRARDPDETYGE